MTRREALILVLLDTLCVVEVGQNGWETGQTPAGQRHPKWYDK